MTAEQTTLAMIAGIQVLGAIPAVPEPRGPFTWCLKWLHDALQAIARNNDKIR